MWHNRILDQMDRLFGPFGLSERPEGAPIAFPALNLWEDDDNLYVETELPGMAQDQIEITVAEGDQLTIAGERNSPATQGCIWHRQECGYGRFSRTVTLPAVVNADAVSATCENGVLSITLPKSEMARPKRIKVLTGNSSRTAVTAA